jgi:hypothetical protein
MGDMGCEMNTLFSHLTSHISYIKSVILCALGGYNLMAGNVAQMSGKVEEECEKRGSERSDKPG